jgi:predicted RNA-binding Zn-ribbon protein involved in translation (DUF1610 family)
MTSNTNKDNNYNTRPCRICGAEIIDRKVYVDAHEDGHRPPLVTEKRGCVHVWRLTGISDGFVHWSCDVCGDHTTTRQPT